MLRMPAVRGTWDVAYGSPRARPTRRDIALAVRPGACGRIENVAAPRPTGEYLSAALRATSHAGDRTRSYARRKRVAAVVRNCTGYRTSARRFVRSTSRSTIKSL